jgi:hypothetical protein
MNPTARYGYTEHEEIWLLLPWLANGRLPEAQRERAQQHVKVCSTCSAQLDLQRRLCEALSLPEHISHAPGPSLARLMSRIDRASAEPAAAALRARRPPPRLAWAASVLVTGALAGALGGGLVYRGLTPAYQLRTDAPAATGGVLHIAFARDLTIAQMTDVLAAAGAQVVEGPGAGGVFAVRPVGARGDASLQQLSGRLRADPRVRWIEPLTTAADSSAPPHKP